MTFRIYLSLVTFTCTIKMTSIFFQSVGEPVKAAVISLVRDLVCFVPLAILLPKTMGITGILWAAPVADMIGMIVSMTLVTMFLKFLDKEDNRVANDLSIKQERGKNIIIDFSE